MIRAKGITVHNVHDGQIDLNIHEECSKEIDDFRNDYHWIVCPHGETFEGLDPDIKPSVNGSKYGNNNYYAVLYLGETLTSKAKSSINKAMSDLSLKKAHPHSFFGNVSCPGKEIQTWLREGRPEDPEEESTVEAEPHKVFADPDPDEPKFSYLDDIEPPEDDDEDSEEDGGQASQAHCDSCDRDFKTAAGYASHFRAVHDDDDGDNTVTE